MLFGALTMAKKLYGPEEALAMILQMKDADGPSTSTSINETNGNSSGFTDSCAEESSKSELDTDEDYPRIVASGIPHVTTRGNGGKAKTRGGGVFGRGLRMRGGKVQRLSSFPTNTNDVHSGDAPVREQSSSHNILLDTPLEDATNSVNEIHMDVSSVIQSLQSDSTEDTSASIDISNEIPAAIMKNPKPGKDPIP